MISRPLILGLVAGGLLGLYLAHRRTGTGMVTAAPKVPKPLRQRNRRNLPGRERGIGA